MAWTKPMISEISVGLEINSYACAEVISIYKDEILKAWLRSQVFLLKLNLSLLFYLKALSFAL